MQRLYGSQAEPMARVIQGVPTSWDPSIAKIRFPGRICATAWSPCSRLIATAHDESSEIVVLDAVTLKQLHTMYPPQDIEIIEWGLMIFSHDGHLLTGYSGLEGCIISWELQTGGLLSNINTWGWGRCDSVSYSLCGTMIGGLFGDGNIIICNVYSGAHISSHTVQQPIVKTIWTHGEYLQFAIVESESITIWQVSFTSDHVPTKVGSLSAPNTLSSDLVLLPALLLLAFIDDGRVLVWDVQNRKFLLDSTDVKGPRALSFSPDGCFFACGTRGREFHIWKKSSSGYLSHQQLVSGANRTTPCISPEGKSLITSSDQVLQLWHTENLPTPLPSVSGQASPYYAFFFIEFSPDGSLVAITERLSNTVTIFDMKSGNPWVVIDTDTNTCGLRITEDKVIVVGDGKIVTWDLPERDGIFNTRININDSVQTTTFKHSLPIETLHASISPNLNYVAFGSKWRSEANLCIYNMHTGEKYGVDVSYLGIPGFTPNSHEVWSAADDGKVGKWEIFEENESDAIYLEQLEGDIEPPNGFPWQSICGYQITDDGWILSSSGKRLLWLPYHWRQDEIIQRKWSGKYLVIWNRNSLEPSILELEI